jgi:Spherulation-specific family 4
MRTRRLAFGALVAATPLVLSGFAASASVPTSSEHIIVSLYAQPSDAAWSQVESAGPTVSASILDICAADGSGSGGCSTTDLRAWDEEPPTAWATLIMTLQGDGITPLIYIATDFGNEDNESLYTVTEVEAEIKDAVGWWGPNIGFMFDQGATTCALESSYYLPLYNYVKSMTNNGPVEINPGTVNSTMSCYLSAANILQVFEGDEADFDNAKTENLFPSWMATYPARDFAATVSVGTTAGVGTDVTDAASYGIGNVYVDDLPEPPLYGSLPAFWTSEVSDVAAAKPVNPFEALCSEDGPCLEATSSAAGHAVDMATFSSGDQSQNLALYGYAGDYGCAKVTATCPFKSTTLDADYLGDSLINLTFTGLSGSPVAATYPSSDVNTEALSTAPDRDVYVLDNACGSSCAYLLSPYWTNQDGTVQALYGPPLGSQADVSTLTDNTRQSWDTRS